MRPMRMSPIVAIVSLALVAAVSTAAASVADGAAAAAPAPGGCIASRQAPPRGELAQVQGVASKDLNLLVTLSGHIKLMSRHYAALYVPLELSDAWLDYDGRALNMTMAGNCARLTVPLKRTYDGWLANHIELGLDSDSLAAAAAAELAPNQLDRRCKIQLGELFFSEQEAVRCPANLETSCVTPGGDSFAVHLAALAFEINGEQADVAQGLYSSQTNEAPCMPAGFE